MLLSTLIKSLVDVATEVGECEVYLTSQNDYKTHRTALFHYLPLSNDNVLRIEGITEDDDYEDDYDDDDDDYYDDEDD